MRLAWSKIHTHTNNMLGQLSLLAPIMCPLSCALNVSKPALLKTAIRQNTKGARNLITGVKPSLATPNHIDLGHIEGQGTFSPANIRISERVFRQSDGRLNSD